MNLVSALRIINSSDMSRKMYLAMWQYVVNNDGEEPSSVLQLGVPPSLHDFKRFLRGKDAEDSTRNYTDDSDTYGFFTLDSDSVYHLRDYAEPFKPKSDMKTKAHDHCVSSNGGSIGLYCDTQIPICLSLVNLLVEFNTELSIPTQETNTMSTISNRAKSATNAMVAANKDAGLLAAQLAVGKVGLTLANKAIKPKVPMLARGYVGTVYGDAVVANIVLLGVQAFAPENKKANAVANAMVKNAAVMLMQEIDIEALISSMFDGLEGSKIDQLLASEALEETHSKIIID